jgi:acyl-coenzyme A thioesterase 9
MLPEILMKIHSPCLRSRYLSKTSNSWSIHLWKNFSQIYSSSSWSGVSSSTTTKPEEEDKSISTSTKTSRHHSRFQSPIVAKLWEARSEFSKNRSTDISGDETAVLVGTRSQEREVEPSFKHPKDSLFDATYPFTSDEYLREAYKSPGGTMRFGKLLEDLDALAATVAFQHVTGTPMLVTAAVDRIALHQLPALDKNQRLLGQVTWVGTSSMEILVQLHEVNEETKEDHKTTQNWLEAYFTFVALDPITNKPTKITPLVPETHKERELFDLGAMKAMRKKEARKRDFFHDVGKVVSEEAVRMENMAKNLLQQAFPLLRMPTLADPNSILMDKTCLENSLIAQPQARNLNDRIFGGFLMRRGFELAFATAYVFGGEWPHVLEVDNVTFYSPVDVGDLLQFMSRVIYSLPEGGNLGCDVADHKGKPLVMVEVECWITEPAKVQAKLSNRFYFTFMLPTKTSCRMVLPGSLEEARRMVERMAADEEQAKLSRDSTCKGEGPPS